MKKFIFSLLLLPMLAFADVKPNDPTLLQMKYHFKKVWSSDTPEQVVKKIKENDGKVPVEYEGRDYQYTDNQSMPLLSSSLYSQYNIIASEVKQFPPDHIEIYKDNQNAYGVIGPKSSCVVFAIGIQSESQYFQKNTNFYLANIQFIDHYVIPNNIEECDSKNKIVRNFTYSVNVTENTIDIKPTEGNAPFSMFKTGERTTLIAIPSSYKKDSFGNISYLYYFIEMSH